MKNNILIQLVLIGSLALSLQAEYIRDDNKKIVLDSSNGLMWQDDAVGNTMNWTTALTTCENLTLGGFSDWRLPNYNELYNLADRSNDNPALSPIFSFITPNKYWSSTVLHGLTSYAGSINFYGGSTNGDSKTDLNYVRCVRGGL